MSNQTSSTETDPFSDRRRTEKFRIQTWVSKKFNALFERECEKRHMTPPQLLAESLEGWEASNE